MADISAPQRVFISYSHDSATHTDEVLRLAERLRMEGIDCMFDRYDQHQPIRWDRWIVDQVNAAIFVLVICTAAYKRRAEGHETPPIGRGANFEGALIGQYVYDRG